MLRTEVEGMVAPKPSTMYTLRIGTLRSEHIDLESHIKVKENTHSLFIAADRRHRVKNKHLAKQGGNTHAHSTNDTIQREVRSKQAKE